MNKNFAGNRFYFKILFFAGDTLGVMRTGAGILHFLINGQDQGVAAHSIPSKAHAVVDIYGKCMQVTINSLHQLDTNRGTCES